MRVDAKLLADHIRVVSMNGRLQEVLFGPDFSVEAVDANEEVLVKGRSSKVSFKDSFGVMDLSDFSNLIGSFNGEVNMDVKDSKVVVGSSLGVVSYQVANPDTITSTVKNFADLLEKYLKEPVVKAKVAPSFPGHYAKFQRLISPDLVEISMKDGKVQAALVSMKGHRADLVVGEPTEVKDEGFSFKLLASSLTDVLKGFVTTQSHVIQLAIGLGLVLTLDEDYQFILAPKAD